MTEASQADEDFVQSLNARISQMGSVRESMEDMEPVANTSFDEISDSQLAEALNSRLSEEPSSSTAPAETLTGVSETLFRLGYSFITRRRVC